MTEMLLKRARDVAPDAAPAETSLLIVAHGTDLNENSAVAAKREAEKIRALGKYAAVLNVYMEEAPLVSDWRKLTETRRNFAHSEIGVFCKCGSASARNLTCNPQRSTFNEVGRSTCLLISGDIFDTKWTVLLCRAGRRQG